MTFFYQRGCVSTTKHWQRPTHSNIQKFLQKTIPVVEALDLELWVQGRSLRDIADTWDFDCYILGRSDPQTQEDLQLAMLDYALNHCDLLVDPYWASQHSDVKKNEQGHWHGQDTKIWLLYPIHFKTQRTDKYQDLRSRFPCVSTYLVELNWKYQPVKRKHWQYLDEHQGFPREKAQDYLLSLELSEKKLNNIKTNQEHHDV